MKAVVTVSKDDKITSVNVLMASRDQLFEYTDRLGYTVEAITLVDGFVSAEPIDIRSDEERIAACRARIAQIKHELKTEHGLSDALVRRLFMGK